MIKNDQGETLSKGDETKMATPAISALMRCTFGFMQAHALKTRGLTRLSVAVLGLIVAFSALLTLSAPVRAWDSGIIELKKPWSVPFLKLQTIEGDTVDLQDLKGKVVIVNFWAWWCPSCKKELPDLERLWRRKGGEDFAVIAVHVGGSVHKAKTLVRRAQVTFPVLLDRRNAIAHLWGVTRYPTTLILGRDGKVYFVMIGSKDWNDAETEEIIATLSATTRQAAGKH